jgi:hypothetical protein
MQIDQDFQNIELHIVQFKPENNFSYLNLQLGYLSGHHKLTVLAPTCFIARLSQRSSQAYCSHTNVT